MSVVDVTKVLVTWKNLDSTLYMGTADFSESLFRADHSSRGILPSVVVKPRN